MLFSKINKYIFGVLLFVFILFACSACTASNIYRYKDAKLYTKYEGEFEVENAEIDTLDISWICGKIFLYKSEDNKFHVKEESLKEKYYKMYYLEKESTFFIKNSKSGIAKKGFDESDKALYVYVPETVTTLILASVSSNILVDELRLSALRIDNVSGDVELKGVNVKDVNIDSVSGVISASLYGTKVIDIDTVSGNIDVKVMDKIEQIDIDSVSGNIELYFTGLIGYDLEFDSVSGKVTREFNDGTTDAEKFDINVDTISANLYIKLLSEE